jgi:hypothetical protein
MRIPKVLQRLRFFREYAPAAKRSETPVCAFAGNCNSTIAARVTINMEIGLSHLGALLIMLVLL